MRRRDVPVLFWVTEKEMDLIRKKMNLLGTKNQSAYLRKMAIDGHIIKLNLPELNEIVYLMKKTSNNVNQIAHRANIDGVVTEHGLREMNQNMNKLWEELRSLLDSLGKIE